MGRIYCDGIISKRVKETKNVITDSETGIITGVDKNGETIFEKFDYDRNGNPDMAMFYAEDIKEVRVYDIESGKRHSRDFYQNNVLIDSIKYKYDDKGRLAEEIRDYNADGNVDFITYITYNEKGASNVETADKRSLWQKISEFFSDMF